MDRTARLIPDSHGYRVEHVNVRTNEHEETTVTLRAPRELTFELYDPRHEIVLAERAREDHR